MQTLDDLPIKVQRLIFNLRKESAMFRIERNKFRVEAMELRAKLAELQDKK